MFRQFPRPSPAAARSHSTFLSTFPPLFHIFPHTLSTRIPHSSLPEKPVRTPSFPPVLCPSNPIFLTLTLYSTIQQPLLLLLLLISIIYKKYLLRAGSPLPKRRRRCKPPSFAQTRHIFCLQIAYPKNDTRIFRRRRDYGVRKRNFASSNRSGRASRPTACRSWVRSMRSGWALTSHSRRASRGSPPCMREGTPLP